MRSFFAVGVLVAGCGSSASSDTTTGKRIVLHTAMTADPAAKSTFTTGFGWDVTLTKAAVATSGLYYFDGPPPTAIFRAPRLRERMEGLFIGTAWAHPGHYQAGTALGQVLLPSPVTLDAFAPPHLADGDGITGTYRSARVVIPQSSSDALLAGHVGIAEGKATKHDGTSTTPIYFRLVADFADIAANVNNGAVDGCVLDETTVGGDGTITVEVKPSIWLNLVDFSPIAPGSPGSPTEARNAGFSQGITELSAYHFTYSK